jgi:hypothetical protein
VFATSPCSADTTTPTSHKKAGTAASTPTGYPNGSHPAGSTKTNNPTSTPASEGCIHNGDSTATNDSEHPQPHNGIRWSWPKSAPLEADKPGLDSMHFSTGTDQ